MRIGILLLLLALGSCKKKTTVISHNFSSVKVEVLLKDSISVRAIEVYQDSLLGFGFDKGYGFVNLKTNTHHLVHLKQDDSSQINWIAQQRAVSFANNSFYSLSIGSPARLRRIAISDYTERIVYEEEHPKVFYDAMAFWNDAEGIAIGDPTEECMSIIITRDEGETWNKISCDILPKTIDGEAAFAASNGNIAIIGDHTWVLSGGKKSRVFYSPDKGKNWQVFETPLLQGTSTTGGYAIQFYDTKFGVIFGGDYTKPENNKANKAITIDGGKTWKLIADGTGPGYQSCVRYIPNGGGKELVSIGFTGISISNNGGNNWKELSKEEFGFYTIRFINDSTAIAAGKGSIARIHFRN